MTFCVVRCALDELNLQLADADDADFALELPPIVDRMLWETVAVNAMQFQGFVFEVVHTQVPISTRMYVAIARKWVAS